MHINNGEDHKLFLVKRNTRVYQDKDRRMIRKIEWRGSRSWVGTVRRPWGETESESWSDSKYRFGNFNFNRTWAKSWSSFSSWCWNWSATKPRPISESWEEDI